jgi:hypothetical protein
MWIRSSWDALRVSCSQVGACKDGWVYKHDCIVLLQNLRQLGAVGICAELILRSLEVLQGILQTRDF